MSVTAWSKFQTLHMPKSQKIVHQIWEWQTRIKYEKEVRSSGK